jgi:hypothetical protein
MRISLGLTLVLFGSIVFGVEGSDSNASGGTSGTVAPPPITTGGISLQEAEQLVTIGKHAMQESNEIPSRSVDAAVAFSRAIQFYTKIGDTDTVCDLEANIFWCKKRMNLDDENAFLASKHGDKSVKDALAQVDQVATKTVPKEDAQKYFDRAMTFASEHPEDSDGIIAHYIEVAERFVGTDLAVRAQKLSIDAQNKQRAQYQALQHAQHETLFTRSSAIEAEAGHRAAIPDAPTLRSAISEVRKLYQEDYARNKLPQRRRLAVRLLKEVPETKDDPTTQYALLNESITLSVGAGDWYTAFTACDHMAALFDGIDAKTKKKEVFTKAPANPTVKAILKLLDNPEDAAANLVVGKYFCFDSGNWDIGLPLLAHGSDQELQHVAEMEQAKPSAAPEQLELADTWYTLAKKAKPPVQKSVQKLMLSRAVLWYNRALPTLTGLTVDRISQRLDELYLQVPEPGIDYDHITVKQWDRLLSNPIDISAANPTNDIGLTLGPGDKVRIVPHPTDTWTMDFGAYTWPGGLSNVFDTDATGNIPKENTFRHMHGGGLGVIGVMMVRIGGEAPVHPGVIQGEGKVEVGPNLPGGVGEGRIRIKVLVIPDDEP